MQIQKLFFRKSTDFTSVKLYVYSTVQTSSLRILHGAWEFAQLVHMCFVDLETASLRVMGAHGV